jgi:pilus assembly protein Flp/PilA
MKNFLQAIGQSTRGFMLEEEGAQVVEYALIIAVVSIALVIALQVLTTGATFTDFIARVNTCLTTATCV